MLKSLKSRFGTGPRLDHMIGTPLYLHRTGQKIPHVGHNARKDRSTQKAFEVNLKIHSKKIGAFVPQIPDEGICASNFKKKKLIDYKIILSKHCREKKSNK